MKLVGILALVLFGYVAGMAVGYAIGYSGGADHMLAIQCELAGGHIGPITHSCVFPR